MWPFTPRFVDMPNGRRITYRAFREQERQELRAKAARAKKTEKLTDLEITREQEAYTEEKAERVKSRKAQHWSKVTAAIVRQVSAFRHRLAEDRPLLAALIVAGICLVLAVGGQIMVYAALDWHGQAWIGDMLPFAVEGTTWTFFIFAAWLANRPEQLPYSRYTRLGWLFALYAALSNTYHFAINLNDLVTGALLGGASIVGPLVWHSYITLTKVARSGRTGEQIRRALLRRVMHPRYSVEASRLWAAADGAMTRDMAWKFTWMRHKGAAPGLTPNLQLVTARNRWLFRLIFGRVVNPALMISVSTSSTATATATATPSTYDATATATRVHEQIGKHAQPELTATATPFEGIDAEVAQYVTEWTATPTTTPVNHATATPGAEKNATSSEVAQPTATLTATSSATPVNQVARNLEQPTATGLRATPSTAADLVAEYYRNQVADGTAPVDVSPTRAAEYALANGAGCSRQAAAKKLGQLREEAS